MSKLESLEKLRDYISTNQRVRGWKDSLSDIADEIEREIAERYMPLPLDDDESAEPMREFVGLEVDMLSCDYIHGGKAPYYSIVYREDGKLFKGYSSFNIDTVSGYLRDYFISAGGDAK